MRFFSFLLIPLLLISIAGCIGTEPNIDTTPSFTDAQRIVVISFIAEDEEAQELSRRVSGNLAERFKLIMKDKEWVFDISEKVRPVGEKIEELGLTSNDVYADPALAAKVGQALNADIIITGMVSKPKLERKNDNRILMRQGRQTGISGTSTYITTRQRATVKTRVKVIDVATSNLLYNNRIHSSLKYWFAYQTQASGQVIFKEPVEMLADLGNHLPRRILYMLYPNGLQKEPEDKVLLKPDIILKGPDGIMEFN
ncbi:hypothetical protein C6501_10790 [Candidatus Poribacteria bacterium]|nr:MAG: hypothetical protein C6501_10790 [Candidatus Poribacteria bacterium]